MPQQQQSGYVNRTTSKNPRAHPLLYSKRRKAPSSALLSEQSRTNTSAMQLIGNGSRPAHLQTVVASPAGRSLFSAVPHQNLRRRRHARWNRGPADPRPADGGPEDFEHHFHETKLGFFESYFAESVQHLCTFALRNNPGRLLSESPEAPESDTSGDNDDVTVVNQDDVSISGNTKKKEEEENNFEDYDHFESPTVVPASSSPDKAEHEAAEDPTLDIHDCKIVNNDFSCDDAKDGIEEDTNSTKPVYIPDHDLFKHRWYADPWERRPGQLWTKEVQNQHDLAATIRRQGFTGRRGAWLFKQLRKRKGHRFPYKERVSLKRADQTHTQYLAALKKRKEEEHLYENQVKEYDEGKALEECQWTLDLYNMVYGLDWPEAVAKAVSSEGGKATDEDYTDRHEEEEEWTMQTRPRTRHQLSTPEPSTRQKPTGADHGITPIPADQKASPKEIDKRNRDFGTYKARRMEAARIQKETEDVLEFTQNVSSQTFSNGHREMWQGQAS